MLLFGSNSRRRSCYQIGESMRDLFFSSAKIRHPQGASRLARGRLLSHIPRVSGLSAPRAWESWSQGETSLWVSNCNAQSEITEFIYKALNQHVETLAFILYPKKFVEEMHSQSAACMCQVGWSFIPETEKHDEQRQSAESLHHTWKSSLSRRRWALPESSERKRKASLRRAFLWKVWMCIHNFQCCCVGKCNESPGKTG